MLQLKELYKRLLFIIMLTISPVALFAQDPVSDVSDAEEERLEHIVSVYFVGSNDYEFYKAIGNLREHVRPNPQKYFKTMKSEIIYDLNHNYFSKALKKTEQLKDELIEAKAEDLYYIVDYLLGVFYGSRDEIKLCRTYLLKAAKAIEPGTNDSDLLLIYQTLANISIFDDADEGPSGYDWADKAIALSSKPSELSSSLSLKAMIAISHNDKDIFEDCYKKIIKIREDNPDKELSMYWKYMRLGRHVFDGNFDKAAKACDSIPLPVPRLYFLAAVYKLAGDTKAENEALYELIRAKDAQNNEISTLTINDINQEIRINQQRLTSEQIRLYTHIGITLIVALSIVVLAYFVLSRRRRM